MAVAAVAVLVGGCTGEPVPERTTTAATPSASASPVPSPPPRPEQPEAAGPMAEPSADGALAAATHFLDLHRYAFMTGDTAPLRAMSAAGCDYCNGVVAEVEEAVEEGLLTDRDTSEILGAEATEIRPDEWFSAELRIRQGEIRLLGDDGSVLAVDDTRAVVDFTFALSWVDGRWAVDGVDLAEAPQ